MNASTKVTASKVPEFTLAFWVIKIAATTMGETGGNLYDPKRKGNFRHLACGDLGACIHFGPRPEVLFRLHRYRRG